MIFRACLRYCLKTKHAGHYLTPFTRPAGFEPYLDKKQRQKGPRPDEQKTNQGFESRLKKNDNKGHGPTSKKRNRKPENILCSEKAVYTNTSVVPCFDALPTLRFVVFPEGSTSQDERVIGDQLKTTPYSKLPRSASHVMQEKLFSEENCPVDIFVKTEF